MKIQVNRFVATALLMCIMLNTWTVSALSAATLLNIEESNALAESRILSLKDDYLDGKAKPTGGSLVGRGYDNVGEITGNETQKGLQLKENIIGTAALFKDSTVRGDSDSMNWAQIDIYPDVRTLRHDQGTKGYSANSKVYVDIPTRKTSIDQFMFLEFISEAFEQSDDSDMYSDIQNIYRDISPYRAEVNITLYNVAPFGAYWTQIDSNKKYPQPGDANAYTQYNFYPSDNNWPLTNVSLWAAAGCAHFARTQLLKGDEEEYAQDARQEAERALAYADLYCWNTTYQMYHEEQSRSATRGFRANTQIVALLACARLYQLYEQDVYLYKADLILDSIMRNFWIASLGGIQNGYGILEGFDNALFAYALFQLGIATGGEDVKFEEFIQFKRPENKYLGLGESVIAFMNSYMWLEAGDKSIVGYVEWVDFEGNALPRYPHLNTTRMIATNMLAFYCLTSILQAVKPWFSWYWEYLTYVGVILGIILFIVIIRVHKAHAGTKLPKVVKGLLGDEE